MRVGRESVCGELEFASMSACVEDQGESVSDGFVDGPMSSEATSSAVPTSSMSSMPAATDGPMSIDPRGAMSSMPAATDGPMSIDPRGAMSSMPPCERREETPSRSERAPRREAAHREVTRERTEGEGRRAETRRETSAHREPVSRDQTARPSGGDCPPSTRVGVTIDVHSDTEVGRLDASAQAEILGAIDDALGHAEVDRVESAAATETSATAAADRAVFERAARCLANLGDPDALLALMTARMRDDQTSVRESSSRTENERATRADRAREEAVASTRAAENGGDDWAEVANVLGKVGAVVAALVALATTAFTGGLGAVAAVGIVVATFGPMVCEGLRDAGVLEEDVALAIGAGCAVAGTAASLGAGAAAGAAGGTSLLVGQAATAARVGSAAIQTAAATSSAVSVGHGYVAAEGTVAQARARLDHREAVRRLSEDATSLASILESARRTTAALRDARDTREAGMTAALSFRA